MHKLKERKVINKSFLNINTLRIAMLAAVAVLSSSAGKLGAWQPRFLAHSDEAVLVSPRADFEIELHRLNLASSGFRLAENYVNYHGEAASGEIADLAAALKKAKVSQEDAERIHRLHAKARAAVREFAESAEAWGNEQQRPPENGDDPSPTASATPPVRPALFLPEDLPVEFADYLEGAVIWHDPTVRDKSGAAAAWERLLARPAGERRWKSTWAAFMLGRYWETNQPEKAIAWFQRVRDLARHGFVDSISLGAGSLGLEARIHLRQKEYQSAIELYLEQYAAGDGSAGRSLEIAASEALQSGSGTLRSLASNPKIQRLITTFLISRSFHRLLDADRQVDPQAQAAEQAWLAATQVAEVKDADSAEKLAWIAYRCNQPDQLNHWSKIAAGSPSVQWIEAKALMREGKLAEAEPILARCASAFRTMVTTNDPPPASLSDNLFTCHWSGDILAGRQILGELGVVRLARGEFVASLDAFLRGGFWADAAYVAERILTLEELKAYVDQDWPRVSPQQLAEEREKYTDIYVSPQGLREKIRFLLARRLTRSFRGDAARDYYPPEWIGQFDFLASALRAAWDDSAPANDRARAFMEAAFITKTNGIELLGTEVEPDWHISGGDRENFTWRERETNAYENAVFFARPEEIRRASEHSANPERQFHYRYQAALLAWEAARLLPNESDETAYVLYTAGCWLKNSDPETADILYKALVRRNRRTALGAAADLRHWFPDSIFAEGGVPVEIASNEAEPSSEGLASEDEPTPGEPIRPAEAALEQAQPALQYMVRPGDTLAQITRAFNREGFHVSLEGILQSNPGLVPERIIGGQRIQIPGD